MFITIRKYNVLVKRACIAEEKLERLYNLLNKQKLSFENNLDILRKRSTPTNDTNLLLQKLTKYHIELTEILQRVIDE